MPSKNTCKIVSMYDFKDEEIEVALEGQIVRMNIKFNEEDIICTKGGVL